jgi:ribonuclease J
MTVGSSPANPVRIVALGGLGEIGLNCLVLEYGGTAIIVDCGVVFPERPSFGAGLFVPDLSWLVLSGLDCVATILTHAHEDHIGALPNLLRQLPMPVYGTPLTLSFARRRLRDHELDRTADLRSFHPGERIALGPFAVEAIRVTHSTPDSIALAIDTPAGMIVHSGDFKIDDAPVDGMRFDTDRFAQLGRGGVALLLSDSTNVERPGRCGSESSLRPAMLESMRKCAGKFFVSAFSSHIHRIRQIVDISRENSRLVVPLGRRAIESIRFGIEHGQLNYPPGTFIDTTEAQFVPRCRLTFFTGGSQAEPNSSLSRLAADTHPRVHVEPGDTVVFSSRAIPGNERPINQLIDELFRRGAEVLYEGVAPVHVSGHAYREELAELIRLVRPRAFVPIHGEYRHLVRHAALAVEVGVAPKNCFVLQDGDSLLLDGVATRRGATVKAGRLASDGDEFAAPSLVNERRALANHGAVVAVVAVGAENGRIVAGPELISHGLTIGDGTSALIRQARTELAARLALFEGPSRVVVTEMRADIVRSLREFFQDAIGRRPRIIAHVMEVD